MLRRQTGEDPAPCSTALTLTLGGPLLESLTAVSEYILKCYDVALC